MPARKEADATRAAKAANRTAEVEVDVSVEIGRTRLSVDSLLDLAEGSLIELSKVSGEHVDVLANGEPFARGEVVAIMENFGVRLTEILSPEEA